MNVPIFSQLLPYVPSGADPTGGFPAAMLSAFADPWGAPLEPIVYIRLNDGVDGAPSTLLFPTLGTGTGVLGGETVVELNPITRRREIRSGVVQGAATMLRITNNNGWWSQYDLRSCWIAIYGQVYGTNDSSVFAQGKISRIAYETTGTVLIELTDAMSDALNYTLERDMTFQTSGWLSDMKPSATAPGSKGFDSSFLSPSFVDFFQDETFIIEFTSPTAYKVITEGTDPQQTSSISSDLLVYGKNGQWVFHILAGGWDTSSGAYAIGDRFVIYTTRARADYALTPINLVRSLINSIANIDGYNVLAGTAIINALYDSDYWYEQSSLYNDYQLYGMGGYWPKGTPIIRMINDALKVINGSIYPAPDGTIGLWVLRPSDEVSVTLNGNPSAGSVSIISGRSESDMRDVATRVTYKYKALGSGDDAEHEATDSDPVWTGDKGDVVDIGWEVNGLAIQSAASLYINRYRNGLQKYYLDTTLAGASAEIVKQAVFSDDEMGAVAVQADVAELSIDLLNNSAQIVAYVDEVSLGDYAKVDDGHVDGPEVLW